ncbi:hypothetical protein [Paucibacter sp. Y2R2-4]|uniref:hypothetical protein n=1 Tax=Paucibacter sp. Y2R2-4 TaxID=2893553 RepID=UPI0021E46B9E|nr:hypothetical protein [Paucibacter sp. Y2R2-4]MCV2348693.1 hypothetical protein [Paucibacter sp. Y2R2-4]
MPSMQQEHGPRTAISAGPQRVAPSLAKGLQEELTKALSLALSQLELLGRPGSKRGRLAQRKAQEFVESALETSQLLLADMHRAPEPSKADLRDAASSADSNHELLLNLRRQMAISTHPKVQSLPVLHQGPLPELPRIVARTLTEVTLHLLGGCPDALSGLRISTLAHGLSLQLLCKPMAERESAAVRLRLEGELAGGAATRLALVGAGIGPSQAQHTDVLISIVWPAQADDTH